MNHKIIRTALALFFVSVIITAPRAQQTPVAQNNSPEDRVALYQALLDLTNPWTVMCIAAHPDDEDGTSLIVMRRKYGAHTVSLFSTFGEGGQNAIGPELYEEMGAIRARETMAAAEIQGSEPHFLGLKDFGFSKSADEAFKFWGHDEALRRMVLEIRRLRPDVIITNHNTTNGHGHHQATGRLELEAFDAAADPKRFPEQLKDGVTTWQVLRLFLRVGFGNQLPEQNGGTVTIDPNERDPIRNTVYAEEALRALQKHATQGPWPKTFAEFAARFRAFSGQSGAPGQIPPIRYRLMREAKGAEALPNDSHNFLDGLRLPEELTKIIQSFVIDGRPLTEFVDDRQRVLQTMLAIEQKVDRTRMDDESHLLLLKSRLIHALFADSGITVSFVFADKVLVPGKTTNYERTIFNGGWLPAQANLRLPPPGKSIAETRRYSTPLDAIVNTPRARHLYDGHFLGTPFDFGESFWINGELLWLHVATFVDVAAAVEIERITPSPLVLTPTSVNRPLTFTLHLINHEDTAFKGTISVQGESLAVSLPAQAAGDFQIRLPRGLPTNSSELKFTITGSAAESETVPVSFSNGVVAPHLRVGYVRGFDFSLPNALAALGVESKELSVDEVKTADLQNYSSIIVDNRVYESQPELIAANQKLLDYAKDGGTLIVFYHKSNEWNPDPRRNRPQLAPYKLILGDERITDETAPITFLEPEHPLLNVPNKMGQEDFANWIQERGLYYPKDWDANYHALLQSNDPGEAPLKGGLLVADYGRGHYIYTSMVWYRELRGGVPGAYRMLANMISYGRQSR